MSIFDPTVSTGPEFDPAQYGTEGAATEPQDTMTLDDLHTAEVNVDEARQVIQRSLPPTATYETDPATNGPLTVTVAKVQEKRGGQPTGTFRTVITMSGRAVAYNVRNEEGEVEDIPTGIRFRMSPEVRNKVDFETQEDTDKDDIQTRLWAQAVAAYKATYKEDPKTQAQVVEYLRDTPARYRLIQTGVPTKANPNPRGEPGTMIVAISAKRAG